MNACKGLAHRRSVVSECAASGMMATNAGSINNDNADLPDSLEEIRHRAGSSKSQQEGIYALTASVPFLSRVAPQLEE